MEAQHCGVGRSTCAPAPIATLSLVGVSPFMNRPSGDKDVLALLLVRKSDVVLLVGEGVRVMLVVAG